MGKQIGEILLRHRKFSVLGATMLRLAGVPFLQAAVQVPQQLIDQNKVIIFDMLSPPPQFQGKNGSANLSTPAVWNRGENLSIL